MIELLMITHNRLEYLKKSLPSVLAQRAKLTIWDNASDKKTVDWLKKQKLNVHFNKTNESLAKVTSEVFLDSKAAFVGKVDSDMIIPSNWLSRLLGAHKRHHFGFIGGFHFRPEDLDGIEPIITNGIWQKHHIGGQFLIRRKDFKGYTGRGVMGLSEYQAKVGLPNGYLWNPILWVDHMEDKRSEHYIDTKEYNDYKKRTRGVSLETYQTSIANRNYLKENANSTRL